ncbi:hypothetical protein TNCV_767081 [Trichonephila clavipes]|nr:hypothetical protein TNCV_767081 [Trichonephila clavipes]
MRRQSAADVGACRFVYGNPLPAQLLEKFAKTVVRKRLELFTTCTNHVIRTSANAPQRSMVTYTGMGTVGPGPHGLLRH